MRGAIAKRLFGDLGNRPAVIVSMVLALIVAGTAFAVLNDHPSQTHPSQPHQIAVPMQRAAGVFVVPVTLNGVLTLDFAVDSGASDVVVPLGAFMALKGLVGHGPTDHRAAERACLVGELRLNSAQDGGRLPLRRRFLRGRLLTASSAELRFSPRGQQKPH